MSSVDWLVSMFLFSSRSLISNNDNSLSVPRVKSNTGQAQEVFTLAPRLFGTTSCCPSVQPFQLLPSRNTSRHIFWLDLCPVDTSTPDGLLILWNCFLNFAVEHWFSCSATEPGFAGDIGAIEVCLIDWLNDRGSVAYLSSALNSLLITVCSTLFQNTNINVSQAHQRIWRDPDVLLLCFG